MGTELRLRASLTIGRVTGCHPGYSAGSRNCGINPKLRRMPFDPALDVSEDLDPYSARIVHAVARVGPAVAHIAVRDQNGRAHGHGSGVVFAPDGFVLTNHHVIENGERFSVSLPDGSNHSATMVGGDAATDLAAGPAHPGRPEAADKAKPRPRTAQPGRQDQRQTAMARLRRCRRGDLDRGVQQQCNDIRARIAARDPRRR